MNNKDMGTDTEPITKLPAALQARVDKVTGKRPRCVLEIILKKGYCTTEDLQAAGYEHAPRAARDVREQGIPLKTFRMKGADGKNIAGYKLDLNAPLDSLVSKAKGRTALTDKLKEALIEKDGCRCNLYRVQCEKRELQIDHRVPYEIGGDADVNDYGAYQLVCPSANRDKSWACEHCENWTKKDVDWCRKCYYAYPENYEHIAGRIERHIGLVFEESEAAAYGKLQKEAQKRNLSKEEMLKKIIEEWEP